MEKTSRYTDRARRDALQSPSLKLEEMNGEPITLFENFKAHPAGHWETTGRIGLLPYNIALPDPEADYEAWSAQIDEEANIVTRLQEHSIDTVPLYDTTTILVNSVPVKVRIKTPIAVSGRVIFDGARPMDTGILRVFKRNQLTRTTFSNMLQPAIQDIATVLGLGIHLPLYEHSVHLRPMRNPQYLRMFLGDLSGAFVRPYTQEGHLPAAQKFLDNVISTFLDSVREDEYNNHSFFLTALAHRHEERYASYANLIQSLQLFTAKKAWRVSRSLLQREI